MSRLNCDYCGHPHFEIIESDNGCAIYCTECGAVKLRIQDSNDVDWVT